jgi:hypothetical protein
VPRQKDQDRDLSSAKIGDAVLGRNSLARWRKSHSRGVEHEARVIASKKTLNVEVEDATGDSSSQVEAKPLKTSARASSGVRRLLCSVILPRSASHGVGVKL